jgi:hypothetical protein
VFSGDGRVVDEKERDGDEDGNDMGGDVGNQGYDLPDWV